MTRINPVEHIPQLPLTDDAVARLAERFGTPMYVYDETEMRRRWRDLVGALPAESRLYYSVKANPNPAVVRVFAALGAWSEVVSAGELWIALRAGIPAERLLLVGPGKSARLLEHALEQGVGCIVVESPREVQLLRQLARQQRVKPRVGLRLNPGEGKGGRVQMGGATQFGMEEPVLCGILDEERREPVLAVDLLHAYLGTQVRDAASIAENTQRILASAGTIQERTGHRFGVIDVGGGFPIPYHAGDPGLDLAALREALSSLAEDYRRRHPWTRTIAFESGRFLVGSAGVFVTRVVDVKENRGERFVILDGGTNVFPLDTSYGQRPVPMRVLGDPDGDRTPLTLCGPLCTSVDRLAAGVPLPPVKLGDLVIFHQAGAYSWSAGPGWFLGHGFVPEVLCGETGARLVRSRLTVEDLLAHDPACRPPTEIGHP